MHRCTNRRCWCRRGSQLRLPVCLLILMLLQLPMFIGCWTSPSNDLAYAASRLATVLFASPPLFHFRHQLHPAFFWSRILTNVVNWVRNRAFEWCYRECCIWEVSWSRAMVYFNVARSFLRKSSIVTVRISIALVDHRANNFRHLFSCYFLPVIHHFLVLNKFLCHCIIRHRYNWHEEKFSSPAKHEYGDSSSQGWYMWFLNVR